MSSNFLRLELESIVNNHVCSGKPNVGPLKMHQELLNIELSLQLHKRIFTILRMYLSRISENIFLGLVKCMIQNH